MEINHIGKRQEIEVTFLKVQESKNFKHINRPDQVEDNIKNTLKVPDEKNTVYNKNGKITSKGKESNEKKEDKIVQNNIDKQSLTEIELREIRKLQKLDTNVRLHENAHMAAGSGIVRASANYQVEKGPDGRIYAVGGDVSIDASEGSSPEETVYKMQRVIAAALAPSDPSPADRRVASEAQSRALKARVDLLRQNHEVRNEETQASSGNEQEDKMDPIKMKAFKSYIKEVKIKVIGSFILITT